MATKRPVIEKYLSLLKSGASQNDVSQQLIQNELQINQAFQDYLMFLKSGLFSTSQKIILFQIESDGDVLCDHLNNLITVSYSLETEIMYCSMFLTLYEAMHIMPKTRESSDLDRKKWIDIKTLEQRATLNYLKAMSDIVNKKIVVAQSFLKHETTKLLKRDNGQ